MPRFKFSRDEAGFYLEDCFVKQKPLRIRFDTPGFIRRLNRAGRKSELIARAAGARRGLKVLDCTAGLARDAFILAALGCHVTLLERSQVIAMLLEDALVTARRQAAIADAAHRVSLHWVDACEYLTEQAADFDVICLDPMFPEGRDGPAVKGEMQLLRRYLGSDKDEDAKGLLAMALQTSCRRIVLKRPPRTGWQAPVSPDLVVSNRSSLYEVFLK